jgi:dCTP deaminase
LGTLNDRQIADLVSSGKIRPRQGSLPVQPGQVQPASLDLRIGNIAYRVRSSFLSQGENLSDILPRLTLYAIDLAAHPYLERGAVYLIPLQEEVDLPPEIAGKANPKSSTGRLDVFTRVLTENGERFDELPAGYRGSLYLEVFSRSFPLKVRPGLSLSQLRLFRSRSILSDFELGEIHRREPLFWFAPEERAEKDQFRDGVSLAVDLSFERIVGYRARSNSAILDLCGETLNRPESFWEPIVRPDGGELFIEPESFYLFASKARIRIPVDLAGEMVEFDAQSGELRTHYAGFFDPGFGLAGGGARAVLEIRPHDVPFRVVDGQKIFRLRFERMEKVPDHPYGADIGSNYSQQGLKLSKYFADFRTSH